jgi:hypothetical protein
MKDFAWMDRKADARRKDYLIPLVVFLLFMLLA